MSEVKVNKISPRSSTTVTLGDASDVFQLPASAEIDIASGATLDVNGTIDLTGATTTGFPAGGGGIAGVQVYSSTSSPHTWTKSTRESATGKTINRLLVEVQAGGGGGGVTVNTWGGGGGGAGGYAMKLLDVTSIDTCTATVGASVAAGTGGVASSFAHASGGVAFTTIACTGGAKGEPGENPGYGNGGGGGSGSDGDLNIDGMNGNEGLGNGQTGGASRFSGTKLTTTGGAQAASANNYGHGGYGASTSGGGLILVWEIS